MKIAIMGTGGVGGYYGGLLAKAGHGVTFIARGANLRAIVEKGLQVKSVFGDFQVLPAQATDKPAEVGLADGSGPQGAGIGGRQRKRRRDGLEVRLG